MPGRNGTGLMDAGPMTGRGFGLCPGAHAVRDGAGRGLGLGLGLACRRGFERWSGKDFAMNEVTPKTKNCFRTKKLY